MNNKRSASSGGQRSSRDDSSSKGTSRYLKTATEFTARTLVSGRAVRGTVIDSASASHCLSTPENQILVKKRLLPEDCATMHRVSAFVCEDGGPTDHASVICRISGKPVMRVKNACDLFKVGHLITLAPGEEIVFRDHREVSDHRLVTEAACFAEAVRGRQIELQVSIIGETEVRRANSHEFPGLHPNKFFLREELTWICEGIRDPFFFTRTHGSAGTATFLKSKLLAAMNQMKPGQTLNYRSLDMRTDEFPSAGFRRERNPALGLHGIRRSLREPEFLRAELMAAAQARAEGNGKILFSLPFINDCEEFDAVMKVAKEVGVIDLPISIFVETPAAVSELPGFLDRGVRQVFIGSKDLAQMIYACDRGNSQVSHMADTKKPAVMEAVRRIVSACSRRNVLATLFSSIKDIPFFLSNLSDLAGLSICCGEYAQLDLLNSDNTIGTNNS